MIFFVSANPSCLLFCRPAMAMGDQTCSRDINPFDTYLSLAKPKVSLKVAHKHGWISKAIQTIFSLLKIWKSIHLAFLKGDVTWCLSEPNTASFSYRTEHGFKLTKHFSFETDMQEIDNLRCTQRTCKVLMCVLIKRCPWSMPKHACTLFPPDNLLEAWVLNVESTYLLSLQLTTRLKTVICVHRTAHKT